MLAARWAVAAAILAAAVFSNSLQGGFVIDDGSAVRTNDDLRPTTPVSRLLEHDYWGRPIDAVHSVKSYRPLAVLSFRANFAWHGLDVEGYHIANVLLHALCSAIVGATAHTLAPHASPAAPAVASLLFAAHPVHAEAVASIVGRAELLCCLFYLPALLCYMSAAAISPAPPRHSAQRRKTPRAASAPAAAGASAGFASVLARTLYLLCALCLGVLSTASKETGITCFGAMVGLDLLAALRPLSAVPSRTRLRMRVWCGVRCAVCVSLTTALFVGSMRLRGSQLSPYFSYVDNPLPSLPRLPRALTTLHVHVRYCRLLLWPAVLCADYSYNCIRVIETWASWRNLPPVVLYASAAWWGVSILRAHRRDDSTEGRESARAGRARKPPPAADAADGAKAAKAGSGAEAADGAGGTGLRRRGPAAKGGSGPDGGGEAEGEADGEREGADDADDDCEGLRAAGRALVLLVIPMVPAMHLFLPIGTVIAERLLYLPSVGFCILVGIGASAALRGGVWRRRLALALITSLLCAASARTLVRNRDWHSSDTITAASARSCPGSAKAQISLGTMHLQQANHTAAREAFRAALAILPTYPDALYWLGRLSFMEDRLEDAERMLLASLEHNSGHPEARLFAGICASRRGDDHAALDHLEVAATFAPHNAEIVRDYGAMLFRLGRSLEALPVLLAAKHKLEEVHRLTNGASAQNRGALSSALVKLSATYLSLNMHAECLASANEASLLEPAVAPTVAGLAQICERAPKEGLDTSKVKIDMVL